jgi:hypothetical protein
MLAKNIMEILEDDLFSNLIVLNVNKSKVGEWNMNLIEYIEIYWAFMTEQSECSSFHIIRNILDFLSFPI